MWWRHQMGTFSVLLAVCAIHRSPVNSPHKGQWRGTLMFPLICTWTNRWANNGDAGDLRRHRAHYDVVVMPWAYVTGHPLHVWHLQYVCGYLSAGPMGRSTISLLHNPGDTNASVNSSWLILMMGSLPNRCTRVLSRHNKEHCQWPL